MEMFIKLSHDTTLVVESWLSDENREIFSPEDTFRDYFFRSNEVLNNLKGMRILYYNEDRIQGKHTVRCLAQKPLDKDVAKYGLFDMASGPKESGKSAQQLLAESLFKKK